MRFRIRLINIIRIQVLKAFTISKTLSTLNSPIEMNTKRWSLINPCHKIKLSANWVMKLLMNLDISVSKSTSMKILCLSILNYPFSLKKLFISIKKLKRFKEKFNNVNKLKNKCFLLFDRRNRVIMISLNLRFTQRWTIMTTET